MNTDNRYKQDVTEIFLRLSDGAEYKIPVFGMNRSDAVQAYELMQKSTNVVHACAFVTGGNRI